MKNQNTILLMLFAISMLWLGSCNKTVGIQGNNQVTSETRQLVSFDQVENEGTFNVFIIEDSVFSARVEAESNLIPYIRTRVNGNTLVIDTRENLRNNQPINVYVKTPTIHAANLSGSGYMSLDSLDTDYMTVEISGSGNINGTIATSSLVTKISGSGNIDLDATTDNCDTRISGSGNTTLNGQGNTGTFTISGSGQIQSYNFYQSAVNAKISGSGDMFINVSNQLDINISGSGSVYYVGDPSLNVTITGSGNVIKQ